MSCKNKDIIGALNLGCFSHCGEICLPVIAPETGQYLFSYNNKGSKFTNKVFAVKDEKFQINNIFNESSFVIFQAKQPDGSLLQVETEGVTYDTFYFKVEIVLHAVNLKYEGTEYRAKCN